MKPELTVSLLCSEARTFAEVESKFPEPTLYGVTDGKAVGTYLEQKFRNHLRETYEFGEGNSAKGIDFPSLDVDMKVTSVKKPQSSCPFKSARQKIFGLGYHLLIFVYEKFDDPDSGTGTLDIKHTIFVDRSRTADYQTTTGLRRIVENDGNEDDLMAFMEDQRLPVEEIERRNLAEEILKSPPATGYLTISNALQWRLAYGRVITKAGQVDGIVQV